MNKPIHQRFVITGIGLVNSLGVGLDSTWEKMLSPTRSADKITRYNLEDAPALLIHRAYQLCDLKGHEVYTEKESKNWPLMTKASAIATDAAIKQSQLDQNLSNVATLISSVAGGNDMREIVETAYNAGKTKANPFQVIGISYDYTAGLIATRYGWNGPSTSMVSACATSLYTLDYAMKCLAAGDCEVAVVGATDTMVDKYNLYFFQTLRAVSRRDEDYISQPFSNERDGFVMGEGAVTMIVETLEHAQNRGATVIAEICGMGFFTEAEHPTSPNTEGKGAIFSANRALERSGLRAEDICFINAHATSTPFGDETEYHAMNQLFPNSVITSNKGHIGHTMSASGLMELAYGIKSLQKKIATPTANFTGVDFEKDLLIAKAPTAISGQYFLKNSYGFGGKCVSAIISVP
jgi:3-oxoacyl-[acyl-carrier-protein] synthase II